MNTKNPIIPDEILLTKIYFIRGQKVMLDRDLAELYGVETKRLKEHVGMSMNHTIKCTILGRTNILTN